MTEHCIIRADFSSFRHVQGRKVLQLVMEVPIEEAEAALRSLGMPTVGESKWCAIALLDLSKPSAAPQAQAAPPKDRRPFSTLPLSQQAAIRCRDKEFQAFLSETFHNAWEMNEADAAATVRQICQVESRTEFDTSGSAALDWEKVDLSFQEYLTDQRYAGSKR